MSKIFKIYFLVCIVCNAFSSSSFAQAIGNGKDGAAKISGIINAYTYLIQDADVCKGELSVENTLSFSPSDLICIIQMQGAEIKSVNDSTYGLITDVKSAGTYEFAVIDSIRGNTIVCKNAFLHSYLSSKHTQIVRVPQYRNVQITGTLTCPAWDGKTGGIIILDALADINFNADINASAKGFRGGVAHKGQHTFDVKFDYFAEPDPNYYSLRGEGIAEFGTSPFIAGRGAAANAGGGGNIHTTGGGGGANAGSGGDGGWGYPIDTLGSEKKIFGIGGYALPVNMNDRILMGGGGGAGHEHFGNGTDGAAAGGIVIINCGKLNANNHTIYAMGGSSSPSGAFGDGTGGAGAGGNIYISSPSFLSAVNLNVQGGDGGSSVMKGFGPGGGGGGGLIALSASVMPPQLSVANINGGRAGFAAGKMYGAKDGLPGKIILEKPPMHKSTKTIVRADFSYNYNSVTSLNFTNYSKGNNAYHWDFDDGNSAFSINPTHDFAKPGYYQVQLTAVSGSCSDTTIHGILSGLPNVITPNNDGYNDVLSFASFSEINSGMELEIFNRWGLSVWKTTDKNAFWDGKDMDGKPLSSGVYFITLSIREYAKFKGIYLSVPISLLR